MVAIPYLPGWLQRFKRCVPGGDAFDVDRGNVRPIFGHHGFNGDDGANGSRTGGHDQWIIADRQRRGRTHITSLPCLSGSLLSHHLRSALFKSVSALKSKLPSSSSHCYRFSILYLTIFNKSVIDNRY